MTIFFACLGTNSCFRFAKEEINRREKGVAAQLTEANQTMNWRRWPSPICWCTVSSNWRQTSEVKIALSQSICKHRFAFFPLCVVSYFFNISFFSFGFVGSFNFRLTLEIYLHSLTCDFGETTKTRNRCMNAQDDNNGHLASSAIQLKWPRIEWAKCISDKWTRDEITRCEKRHENLIQWPDKFDLKRTRKGAPLLSAVDCFRWKYRLPMTVQ